MRLPIHYTLGSLLQIMILRLLQKHGHRPVVLVGGGTTKVGDPSGKMNQDSCLDEATIQANIDGISSVFDKFIEFGTDKAILVNNADWLDSLGYVEFLRTVGAQVTVNRMLSFESVKGWAGSSRCVFGVQLHAAAGLRLPRVVQKRLVFCRWAGPTVAGQLLVGAPVRDSA